MLKNITTLVLILFAFTSSLKAEKPKVYLPLSNNLQIKGEIVVSGFGVKVFKGHKKIERNFVCPVDKETTIFDFFYMPKAMHAQKSMFHFRNGLSVSMHCYLDRNTGNIRHIGGVAIHSSTKTETGEHNSLIKTKTWSLSSKKEFTLDYEGLDGEPLKLTIKNLRVIDTTGEEVRFVPQNKTNKRK